ncbi:MAG: hypothetical protein V1659_01195, partial [Candidatus Woesearchaeota archaeon]
IRNIIQLIVFSAGFLITSELYKRYYEKPIEIRIESTTPEETIFIPFIQPEENNAKQTEAYNI